MSSHARDKTSRTSPYFVVVNSVGSTCVSSKNCFMQIRQKKKKLIFPMLDTYYFAVFLRYFLLLFYMRLSESFVSTRRTPKLLRSSATVFYTTVAICILIGRPIIIIIVTVFVSQQYRARGDDQNLTGCGPPPQTK